MPEIVQTIQSIVLANHGDRGMNAIFTSSEEAAKQAAQIARKQVDLAISKAAQSAKPAVNPPHLGNRIDIHA